MSREFLVFSYKLPGSRSNSRVYVWRAIKEFGAVFLQQGVVLLPYRDDLHTSLSALRKKVISFGGISTLGKLQFLEEDDEAEIVSEFTGQIDEEYREFIKNCQALIDELKHENSCGDYNFSEVTENEEEYKKFQRWYEKIGRKNYFQSQLKASAADVLKEAKKELQTYSEEVFKRDAT
ncbi:hypothetical protein CAFE_14110 [Caprobacter fermentans]|uniref:ChrB N-terminal domain-containing protein n=1 Tax=Caproicibacter fermentans TaxID=2576756 RepID=A0A6N8HZG4_9FIRM|nr:Chromate resistance protein ChrB [Caproicibacter fermentans]MVB10713.1 hypothetical protein [Caproicibacter fermentans]OCN00477.1 chromate resistance protein ChrB [Clostridium sp. W14A]